MRRARWIDAGIVFGVGMLVTFGIAWNHLHHWSSGQRLGHIALGIALGAAGGKCFQYAGNEREEG